MVDAWKPIDTAPKDGRPIFAMGHNYGNPKAGEHRCWCWWDGMNWRSVGDGSEEPAELLYLFVWWDPSADGGLNPTGFAESLVSLPGDRRDTPFRVLENARDAERFRWLVGWHDTPGEMRAANEISASIPELTLPELRADIDEAMARFRMGGG